MEVAHGKCLLSALTACLVLLPVATSRAADAVVQPVRVCEVLESPRDYDGHTLALLGRFSFRENGRFLSEESCGKELKTGETVWPATLRLAEDSKLAPRPEGALQIDAAMLDRKLAALRERTNLRQYAFGSPEYDRWAIVYGRFEASKLFTSGETPKPGERLLPGSLLYRGDGVIIFIHNR